ncbi:MAG: outer membrane protein assembly factor BamC [Methylovulum sp.]|nr:outer membrane protein assembly factor BamC [Methylovulum sp.]
MKKTKLLITLFITAALPACGYIKSLFPDKEKDYQYTTEIPALVLPADLGRQDILKPPTVLAAPITDTAAEAPAPAAAENQPVGSTVATTAITNGQASIDTPIDSADPSAAPDTKASAAKHEFIPVELVKAADGSSRLRLGVPLEKAWRTIDKALSRKSIEVTSRNKQENTFNLHYDPNEKKLEDSSLWDEALFIFSGFQGGEKEFFVKLIDTKEQTDVVVLDNAQQPASDSAALNLLNLLQETIKADFAK